MGTEAYLFFLAGFIRILFLCTFLKHMWIYMFEETLSPIHILHDKYCKFRKQSEVLIKDR